MSDLFKHIWAAIVNWNNNVPAPQPLPPVSIPSAPAPIPPVATPLFDTDKHAYHSVRVMCDNNGLSVDEKNLICACIYQESQFWNILPDGKPTIHQNIVNGVLSSTDWGICQINDRYHIGPGLDFPSVQYVLANPDKAVQWMLNMQKTGKLSMWVSFSSGAYKQWLAVNSPMWALKT